MGDENKKHESDKNDPAKNAARRSFLQQGGALAGAALMSMVPAGTRNAAWAAGSDAPEKKEVRIGFIPLTDCASVVMASVLGFDEKHGIKIRLSREASWASIRDKVVNGELDAAHVLYGLVYGVHAGIGGTRKDMAVLMTINNNGQGISLSRKLADRGVTDGEKLAWIMKSEPREYVFAQTFPTGTHAMWLYYWLAAHDINPFADASLLTVPPPQMVAHMRADHIDGYCAGEPWNQRAIADNVGFTVATSQEVWKDHPEKVLGTTAEFVRNYPNTARAMTAAVLEASRHIDASPAAKRQAAEVMAQPGYINTDVDVILGRMLGHYQNGLGRTWHEPDHMKFHDDGRVNFPYLSDGMWFLTQHRRWGLLREDVDYLAMAGKINQLEIYRQAAAAVKVSLPPDPMRTSRLIDGTVWDGHDAQRYAGSFAVKAA